MAKAVGVGGVFLKARTPQTLAAWYASQLGINFRVDDLDALLVQLAAAGVRVDPKREDLSYGRFAWIWDPEGNRVELWEPTP
jgi:predicted enzyme related to lactoylglutathione lyase